MRAGTPDLPDGWERRRGITGGGWEIYACLAPHGHIAYQHAIWWRNATSEGWHKGRTYQTLRDAFDAIEDVKSQVHHLGFADLDHDALRLEDAPLDVAGFGRF
ncbi:hypothetical protein [Ancylobacter rudongensis]|uniref:Uncharacterized protein n=1 Tax=Ancylobacter rudongensis TaxID=177413 RepID=A0A1G4UP67_9HYPH|nr:hypothetical protein [Ancylobacter rudongensis]SCW95443.1 hypothetical protein SAMN05660859_0029 [Ancylobacter rudongensis]